MSTQNNLPIKALIRFQEKGPRAIQEDYEVLSSERGLFVVADGLGGAGVGDVGSKEVCESIKRFLEKEAGDLEATLPFVLRSYFSLSSNVLFNGLLFANQKIIKLNHGKSSNQKAGASVIAGFMDGSLLSLASVGVCQAWIFRDGVSQEIVWPRTYQRLLSPISKEASWDVPLMALGMSTDLEPEMTEIKMQSGDIVLFQTDGMKQSSFESLKTELAQVSLRLKAGQIEIDKESEKLQNMLKVSDFIENYTAQVLMF